MVISIPMSLLGTTDEIVATYVTVQSLSRYTPVKDVYINENIISYYLYGNPICTKRQKEKIKMALEFLVEKDILTKDDDDNYLAHRDKYCMQEQFANVDSDNIAEVNYKLLRAYVIIMGSRNYNLGVNGKTKVISTMPITYFAEKLGCSKNTMSSLIDKLEHAKLIYVYRVKYDGEHRSNIYSAYEDRDYAISYGESIGGPRKSMQQKGNFRRSVVQRYNAFCKGAKYSPEQIKQLREDVIKYNAEMDEMQKLQPGNDYTSRKKDVSILALT